MLDFFFHAVVIQIRGFIIISISFISALVSVVLFVFLLLDLVPEKVNTILLDRVQQELNSLLLVG